MSDRDEFGAFLVGFVVGGLTGAVVALLFAPQSGEETRALIKDKSIEIRDRAATSAEDLDRKSTRLNSSHMSNSYAVFCLKKKIYGTNVGGGGNSIRRLRFEIVRESLFGGKQYYLGSCT